MLLISLSCAWIIGIYLGSNFHLPVALSLTGLIPLPLVFFLQKRRKAILTIGLGSIVVFTAAAYAYASLYTVTEHHLHFYNDRGTVAIKGMVANDPEVGDKTTQLRLSVSEIRLDQDWQPVNGTALLITPRYPTHSYGDVLLATGKPETPSSSSDFDYKGYLAHQGIYSTMSYPKIEVQSTEEGLKVLAWVYSLRNQLAQTLAKVLPEPQMSLAEAIVLGKRGMIPQSLKDDFTLTGTVHLIAISGLNLTIIVGLFLSFGIWLLGRRHYFYIWLALVAIWAYALLTGMQPPVVRSAIMATLFLAAELLGRQRSAITALTLAAAVMTGISPYILSDASFQMSFLAMAGLVFIFPTLQTMGRKVVSAAPEKVRTIASIANFTSDSLAVTMAAIIAVWPVVAYYFGIVSLVGPLATLLALPILPAIIATVALTGVAGLVFLPAAQVIGWLAWLFLSYLILVVSGLAIPSLSAIQIGQLDPAFLWTYYLALALAIWLNYNRRWVKLLSEATSRLMPKANNATELIFKHRKWLVPSLLVIAVLVSVTAATMPDNNLHVSFLDVGEGDAILIQKGNQQVLVDGGPSPQAITSRLGSKMPFWDRTIELVVLTHPHLDHLTGLVEILKRFQVKHALYPELDYESPLYDECLKLIDQKNIKRTVAHNHQQITLDDGIVITVLNPPITALTRTESDIDNNSVVLRLRWGNVSFLLTADIMKEAEWELIKQRVELSSTVLKVAHHGSDTSTMQDFLAVVKPQLAVISVGEANRFGHPGPEVMVRLKDRLGPEKIYRTDQNGTIEFVTDGQRLWVRVGKRF